MRRHAVVVLAVFALSQSAFGGDLPVKALDAPAPYDWTGYYAGAHLDYRQVSLAGSVKIHFICLSIVPILVVASAGSKSAHAQAKLDTYYTATLLRIADQAHLLGY
jgi:hypothetical protein